MMERNNCNNCGRKDCDGHNISGCCDWIKKELMEDKYGYHHGPEVCTYCGCKDFEDTVCCSCGKFTGESLEEFEERLFQEEQERRWG